MTSSSKNISARVQNEIPYKTYISNFSQLENLQNEVFCNLFIERPS